MTEAKKKWTVFQRSSTRVALGLAVSLSAIAIFPSTLASQPSPNVATDYNNLALSLQAQGKYAEAESLFRQVIEIDEKVLGKDHPDVATAYSNLALLLQAERKYAEAESLFRRAIEIDEKALGKDHPKVTTDYRNLNNLIALLRTMASEMAAAPASRPKEETAPSAPATPAAPPRQATLPSAPQTKLAPQTAPGGGGGGGGGTPPKEASPPLLQAPKAAQRTSPPAPQAQVQAGLPPDAAPSDALPQFPWPPPTASGSYVLPDNLLQDRRTVGEAAAAIISALEFNGYVERSFFQTEVGGVALVTRLERINNDGSSVVGSQRWSLEAGHPGSTADLIKFLRGLFFIDPGHYRVIVFILQDLPFSQSSRTISEQEATRWLTTGFNYLPSSVAERPFTPGGHCTVLVYEFASDGTTVHVITSGLTGKQHLEKAGVLSRLGNVQ
jgi:tetratricopeptide (TPR) repeat protein